MKRGYAFYFGMIMGVIYVISGILLLWLGAGLAMFASLAPKTRIIVGVVLIAYGIFRLGKLQYQSRQNEQNEQLLDDDEN